MNFVKSFIALLFLTLVGCVPSSVVEGRVISSKEIGQGITEHLVETNSFHTPYYILKVNNNNLRPGSKVVLELSANSTAPNGY